MRRWTTDECIDAIKNFHKRTGRTPSDYDCRNGNNLPGNGTLKRRFGSHNGAILAAQLPVNEIEHAYSDQEMLDKLHTFYREHGRFPYTRECLNMNAFPSRTTYEIRFGSWRRAKRLALASAGVGFWNLKLRLQSLWKRIRSYACKWR